MRTALTLLGLLAAVPAVMAADGTAAAPPEGFISLFDGETLSGWIAYPHTDPAKVRAMSPAEREEFLAKHWQDAQQHWSVENGELVNDGHGPYLTTAQDYGDFELRLDYKTVPLADSGIYLRGSPQVQIWDTTPAGPSANQGAGKGSGGLYNNKDHARDPLTHADKPFGEWNTLRMRLVGDSVTVYLNDKLVVNQTTMENYWNRDEPLYPLGPVQLQTHGGEIRFRNLWLKEIPRQPPEAGVLTKEGQPVGQGWKALDLAASDFEPKLRNLDLHAMLKLQGGQDAVLNLESSGNLTIGSNADLLTLTLSPTQGVLLVHNLGDVATTLAATPLVVSGLQPEGENHLYLRIEDGHIQAWINDAPAVDLLYPYFGVRTTIFGDEKSPLATWKWTGISVTGADVTGLWHRDLGTAAPPAPADEAGFEPIFNGVDLFGWTGATDGYTAQAGVLTATPKGGDLFYEQPLDNFVFRFDFKFDTNANNGVGIRVPAGGHGAYDGMEIQILDNTGSQYRNLQPYQYHGSVYGVVPALRGYLNPIGHWNSEEIVADGNHIKVTLNGKVIVDADVNAAAADGTIDHQQHPGLSNPTGYLGFLGHGHRIDFRNLRVKRLEQE